MFITGPQVSVQQAAVDGSAPASASCAPKLMHGPLPVPNIAAPKRQCAAPYESCRGCTFWLHSFCFVKQSFVCLADIAWCMQTKSAYFSVSTNECVVTAALSISTECRFMSSKRRTSWGVLAAAGLVRSLNIRERGLRRFTQQIDYPCM